MRTRFKVALAVLCVAVALAVYGLVTNGQKLNEPASTSAQSLTLTNIYSVPPTKPAADDVSKAAGLSISPDGFAFAAKPLSSLSENAVAFRADAYVNFDPSRGLNVNAVPVDSPMLIVVSTRTVYTCLGRSAAKRYDCTVSPASYDAMNDIINFDVTTASTSATFSVMPLKRAVETGIAGNMFIPKGAMTMKIVSPDDPAHGVRFVKLIYVSRADLLAMNPRDIDGDPISLTGERSSGSDEADVVKSAVIGKILRARNMSSSSVRNVEATVEEVKKAGSASYFHVSGSFTTESDTPRNIYDALSQRLQATQCAVDPHGVCGTPTIKHTVYFDATAKEANGYGSASGFDIDEKVSFDRPISVPDGRLFRCYGSGGETVFSNSPSGYSDCQQIGGVRTEDRAEVASPDAKKGGSSADSVRQAGSMNCRFDAAKLVKVEPIYPPQAVRQGHEGTVVLALVFDRSGNPIDIQIDKSSGFREIDKAAQDSARNWRISKPECLQKSTSALRVPVSFNLSRN